MTPTTRTTNTTRSTATTSETRRRVPASKPWRARRRCLLLVPAAALVLAACGSNGGSTPAAIGAGATPTGTPAAGTAAPGSPAPTDMAGMTAGASPAGDGMGGMPGMAGGAHMADPGRGLLASESGYTLRPMLPTTITLGAPTTVRFQVLYAGAPVTSYMVDQTKLLHFYVVRADVTNYQHLHPQLSNGTWTIPVTFTAPGPYRMYVDAQPIAPGSTAPTPVVLSVPFTVPGAYTPAPVPAPATTSTVDGYTVALTAAQVTAGQAAPLTFTVSKAGMPVTDIQTYLDSYAHMTAYQTGSLAYEHLHPGSAPSSPGQLGGPALAFTAEFAQAGSYRLFLQFQTAGTLHLATFTLPVR